MDKEFYQFLYDLRASGFAYHTRESTRTMVYHARKNSSQAMRQLSAQAGNIHAENLDGEVGCLSDEAIANCRNMLISVAATMNMIAIDSYVDTQISTALCDYFIMKADTIRSMADFEALTASLFSQFQELFSQNPWLSYGRLLDQCVDYVYQRIYSPVTVQEVADHVGYSPTYLTTLFRQKSGMTLYTFIQRCKINEAQRALLCTRLPISSIASALGYHSLSHFSKAFKKAVGVTPLQYRNSDPVKPEKHIDLGMPRKKA